MRVVSTVLLVLVMAAVGCGQLDPPAQRLAEAPARTAAADTARVALESSTSMGEAAGARMDVTVTGEGAVDFTAEQVQLSITMPGPMPGDMEMIMDGDVGYLRMPFVDEERWVRVDSAGSPTDLLQTGTGGSPTDALDALGAVEGQIRELGTEQVRDATTRGYGFEVPASEVFPAEDVEGLSGVTVAMEGWLDDQGRARRISYTVDLGEIMSAMDVDGGLSDDMNPDVNVEDIAGEQRTVVEFFDFGEPVTIEIPDEDMVEDGDYLLEESIEESIEMEPGREPGGEPMMPPPAVEGEVEPRAEPRAEPVPAPQPPSSSEGSESDAGSQSDTASVQMVEPRQAPAPEPTE